MAWSVEEFLGPIAPDAPCGEDLDNTLLIGALDRLNVFGRQISYSTRSKDPGDHDTTTEPEWSEVEGTALEGLAVSRDLRPLVHLGVAGLWSEGLRPFALTLDVAATWLENHWTDVYPRLDEDAMVRQGALLCFADPIAVLNRIRRVPLARSRLQDVINLRDVDIARGQMAPSDTDRLRSETDIQTTFSDAPIEALTGIAGDATRGLTAIKRIAATMESRAGSRWVPDLAPLSALLVRIEQLVGSHVAKRSGAVPGDTGEVVHEDAVSAPVTAGGAIRTRQDALRALDAVAAYFRQSEPSSPVPLLVERAKRLVSKDFLEVLADIAPDGMRQARSAGGLPPAE